MKKVLEDLVNVLADEVKKDFKRLKPLVLKAYNRWQEDERDSVDYIFDLYDQDDLIACIKGGLTPTDIASMVCRIRENTKSMTRFFMFGSNRKEPKMLSIQPLDNQLLGSLNEILSYMLIYPYADDYKELYTELVTTPTLEGL